MYSPMLRAVMARELVRNCWKIQPTLDALHKDYDSFSKLSESTLRKMINRGYFHLADEYVGQNVAQAREETDLHMERVFQRAEHLRDNPVRKRLVAAVQELHDLAKANKDPRTYKVLLGYLELLRSIEIPEDEIVPPTLPHTRRREKASVRACPDKLKGWLSPTKAE